MQYLPSVIGQVMEMQVIYAIATAGVLARELMGPGNAALSQLFLNFITYITLQIYVAYILSMGPIRKSALNRMFQIDFYIGKNWKELIL